MAAGTTEGGVRGFWDSRAAESDAPSVAVTHRDVWQRWLEIEMVKRFLREDQRVLDVGCGNGYATRRVAPYVRQITGIDYSAAMIARAETETAADADLGDHRLKTSFAVMDVLELAPASVGKFDVAVSMRCLINLASWSEQQRAIERIASILSRGGQFIFVEGCHDGRNELDRVRQTLGLEPMPTVWHNIDFRKTATLEFLQRFFTVREELHFGVYDFVSRLLHPLFIAPDEPAYQSKLNEIAARLSLEFQQFGDLSRVLFLVLEKI